MNKLYLIILPLLLILISCSSSNSPEENKPLEKQDLSIGAAAPGFSIESIDGGTISLDRFRGRIVLLDFWASWCGPCVASLPQLKEFRAKYNEDDLVILSISYDDSRNTWKAFVQENNMNWEHGFDGSGIAGFLYDIKGIPWAFLVDAEGRIAYSGYLNFRSIGDVVDNLLSE